MGTDDKWSDWVLDRGHGGQSSEDRSDLAYLVPIRDRVLANAAIRPRDTVLDIGAGDGLIAFGAAELVPNGTVIFSDVSRALLDHAQALAAERGLAERLEFVDARAEALSPLPDGTVDAVTIRSVLSVIAILRYALSASPVLIRREDEGMGWSTPAASRTRLPAARVAGSASSRR